MMDSMYKAPSDPKISKVIITKDSVEEKSEPVIERSEEDVPRKSFIKKRPRKIAMKLLVINQAVSTLLCKTRLHFLEVDNTY